MRTILRKVGNSRGIIIPAALLAACEMADEVDIVWKEKVW
jgi:antitoxin MazE